MISPAQPPPFDLYRPTLGASLPTQLDHAAVALRHPLRQAAFRLSAAAAAGFRSTLDEQGFVEIHTPKIVASATESGANVFGLDYFGRPAYLAQSPQFYKQTMVGVFERVYEVGPVFRAEPHDTVRHLAQYTSLDVELGFIRDHRDVMAGPARRDRRHGGGRGGTSRISRTGVAAHPARGAARDPVDPLHRGACSRRSRPGASPTSHRPTNAHWASGPVREYGSDFLFVVGYPMAKRPFYTHPDPDRPA